MNKMTPTGRPGSTGTAPRHFLAPLFLFLAASALQAQGYKDKYDYVTENEDGYHVASIRKQSGDLKYGFVDGNGREITPIMYDRAYGFTDDGLALVKSDDKTGFIDRTGKEVIPVQYDWAGTFSEGLAPVAIGDRYGFINTVGAVVIPL